MDNNYFYSKTFRDKLEAKSNEPIAPGSKTTFSQLNYADEMARNSIRTKGRREYRVQREKMFKKKVALYTAFGILALAFVCCQAKQYQKEQWKEQYEGVRTVVGHNGEVYEVPVDDGIDYGRGGH
ncbi:MAG: hypothetical protein IJK67_04970 [Bacilli bacterium]|nr:hypothetical protein [Bacilli bacterium]